MTMVSDPEATVPDILAPGLRVVFVGFNPGIKSGTTGHHFAGPGNLFWALLVESGLTKHRLTPEQDRELLYWGIGITNLVTRVTPGSADLNDHELRQGVAPLKEKLGWVHPNAVAFLGKDIYRSYRGWPRSQAVSWGIQDGAASGYWECVLPNPSRRSTVAYAVRLRYFIQLAGVLRNQCQTTPR